MSILDRGLSFTINHLFLPPELPQEYDGLADDERALIVSITDSANAFYDAIQHSPDNIDDSVVDQWLRVQRMLKNFSLLTRGSQEPMDSELLQRTMSSMDDGDVLALLIGAQNAGAIVRKTAGSGLTFESFRAVLPNDVVVNTQGKVQVEYPQTPRLPIPADAEAHKVLCNYLCDFSTLVFSDAFPQSTKAETTQDEHREPPHAWYITELLVDVLRGCSPHLREDELPATDYITKRVDDHVLWKDALMPWRRSPILLVMKVALQTTLLRVPDQIGYKAFMVFALSRVLREAQEAGAPDDLLWRMNAKLARRLYKLRHTNIERFPISIAAAQCGRTARLLRDNWAAVQAAEARPIDLRPPSPSAIEAAQVFSLEHSRSYLDRVQNRDKHEPQSMSDTLARFEATLPKRSRVNGRSPPEPFDAKAPLPELLDALCDIATWLGSAQHDHWLQVADTEAFCSTLGRLLDDTMEALKRFRSPSDSANPELFSLTFLNIMDLWMLLDQAAVRALPLLAQYSPELTIAPLQALLLPDASQMQRLSRIEQYITERHVNGAAGGSVFALNSAGNCSALFSARYAQANNSMRELRDRISAKAEHERSNVLRLRRERCDEHARLLQEASGLSCAYQRVGSKYPPHFGPCAKCDRESQAKHLETPIFEAPLPDNHDLANLVIFELAAPPLFTLWRASTYKLIRHFSSIPDVDRPAHDAKTDIKRYTSYTNRDIFDGLSLRYDGAILLASDRESFLTTHFRRRAVPCIDRDVIKPHGPRYHFYDVEDGCYIPSTLPEMDIRAHCTYTLPAGTYSALAWCLRATTHTSNEVIARQSERPTELTYHEYEAFGHLRAGARLQWRNIALYVETGALRLSDPAVHFLIRQAAFQAEAPIVDGAFSREAHADMADEEFGRQLLDVLRRCLNQTCTNWQESWTALSLSVLARRLNQLLSAGSDVRAKVMVFLRHELRPIILTWMRELSVIVSAKDDATDDLQHRLIQVCLTGKDTFYDDDDVLSADATAQAEALPDFLECTFILHRYVSHQPSSLPDGLRTLVEVDALRAVSSVTNLIRALQGEPNLIDVALSRVWNGFRRDMRVPWSCADTAPEWLSCSTLSEGQHIRAATVHVNVLSGAIFVNGMSSDVLPEEISAHPLYSHIFPRQRRMHIQPSRMLGMTYESRASFDGYEVHFHEDGPDLIIRTRDRQGVVSEFIPSSKLARDVPDDILRRHIALYRVGSAQVDFVPRDERSGWDPSAAVAWTLQDISSSPTLTSATSPPEQTTIVICPHSDVTRNVARIFAPLEKLQEHFMITRSANSSLTVCLPRYRLVFVACNQGFTCKQCPSYIVSSTQSVGTLYGVDKLVLESTAQLTQKRVLVPAGKEIAVSTKEGHTITSITAPACDTPGVKLHIFDVDPCIGRLKTDGSLTGWLMLAYLHAVSSCRQPDELTKERGVDIAIRMLRCAKATAFTRLCRDDVDLLNRLKDLAPIRSFYPMGLRVMETIDWHPGLPFSLHDDIFASLVQRIVKHAQRISLYDPQFSVGILSSLPQVEGENDLRTRALHRKSMWPIHHSPEQCSTDLTSLDRPYIPCDWETNRSTDGIRRNIRDLVADISLWRSRPDRLPQNVWDNFLAWKHLGFTAEATDINLDQPRSLYTLSKPQAWFSLYNLCMSSAGSGRYALMFSFALFLFRDQMTADVYTFYSAGSTPTLDSDVAVRELQSNIAVRMIHGHNRLMQLNMGEGKSSVIIPIASASCSNGQDIVCVVVLKPLFGQMFHILSQRICDLVNRPVFYLPFNRDTPITSSSMRAVEDVLEACAKECGILLCQPDHLLSLQLMATSMQCSGVVTDEARLLIDIHQRLLRHSRYILDESDEILSVKYQLVYTDGQPGPLQDAPERWLVIQAVLDIISANVQSTARKHPDDVEIEDQGRRNECRRFGRIRILSSDACRDLLSASVTAIVHEGGIPFLHLRDLKREQLEETSQFISTYDVSMDVAQSVKVFSGDRHNTLLLLRGLFAGDILSLALKEKRWRVDYGLDRGRTRLAVPYRAKDSPALRAEFGQPDVALVLTSLAYYYGGLTNQDLDVAFERLQMSDDPAVRYEDWTRDLPLLQRLRTLRGVNLEDANQRYDQVYPHLSRVKAVIDFYLAECVFPMEARRFEHKLTANAWDIARRKDRPTTGFSGTNDNQYMLPTSIEQDHSDAQSHTNALVLNHILQKENRTVICKDLNVTGIIDEVVRSQPPVSVILDVGAQVLELENEEVARLWLEKDDSKEAAAYFGSDGDLYVLTRDNRVEQLQRSHYRDQLGKVLVFLDEAHTRGTDLQLPPGTRALVTLGPKMTKDKLVQGCMRMRKLGQPGGHSIVFLANAEIQTRIWSSIKERKSTLDSSDVLVWTLKESIRQTEENGALWAAQGLSFDARESAWEAYNAGEIDAQGLAKALLEPEALTLEELYAPHRPPVFVETERQNDRQRAIWERCNRFGFKVSDDSRLQEEQERELAHEKEQEREVQHAQPATPLPHATDPALMALVATGRMPTQPAFRTLRECLAFTSVEALIPNVSSTFFQDTRMIAATSDFAETIELSAHSPHDKDAFLRSVQWIVSIDKDPNTLLLISPHEANEILPRVRQSKDVHLHLYAPRVTRETRSFDNLTFFTVPSSDASTFRPPAEQIRHELNLFAGNLFVREMGAYRSLCHFLGLHLGKLPEGREGTVDHDGFVSSAIIRAELSMPSSQIHHSPVSVLRSLISLRRKGQGFLLTHLGRMLYGNILAAEDF
ncbi:hypothetical protein K525DRAFT_268624 [Schizophyllum commune Loenen D]|nr:hypothetical protein K525DRAFT_268624 [Schizophyllum commune Loenen D]